MCTHDDMTHTHNVLMQHWPGQRSRHWERMARPGVHWVSPRHHGVPVWQGPGCARLLAAGQSVVQLGDVLLQRLVTGPVSQPRGRHHPGTRVYTQPREILLQIQLLISTLTFCSFIFIGGKISDGKSVRHAGPSQSCAQTEWQCSDISNPSHLTESIEHSSGLCFLIG